MKKTCYDCKHRGYVPGDMHSCCEHPDLKEILSDPTRIILARFASARFEITASYHGIKNGWFDWPWNFDPIWLQNCNMFEEKICEK